MLPPYINIPPPVSYEGMSLRDWFAGQALVGIVVSSGNDTFEIREGETSREALARVWAPRVECAYIIADAMLSARNGEER